MDSQHIQDKKLHGIFWSKLMHEVIWNWERRISNPEEMLIAIKNYKLDNRYELTIIDRQTGREIVP